MGLHLHPGPLLLRYQLTRIPLRILLVIASRDLWEYPLQFVLLLRIQPNSLQDLFCT